MAAPATVRRIAAFGLPGAPRSVTATPPTPGEWRALRSFVRHHRLTGLAVAAARSGALSLTPSQHDELTGDHAAALTTSDHLDTVLVEVSDLLTRGGIEHRILKGPAVARLDYPEQGLRPYGDVDLLVTGEGLGAAVRLLTRAGGERRFPEPRPGFDRRFGKGACVVLPDGTQVDLHRTLTPGPFGLTIDLDDLWSATAGVKIGGRECRALDASGRLLHACLHAALGNHPPRLLALRDIAQVWRTAAPCLTEVLTRARRWGVTAVVARGVMCAWETLGLAEGAALHAWAAEYRPTPREIALLEVYERRGSRYAAQAMASLRVLKGVRNRTAYLRAMIAPSRRYVAGRHRSRIARLAEGLRDAGRRGV